MAATAPAVELRLPKFYRDQTPAAAAAPFAVPPTPWLCAPWHVTHSTLPMWRSNRNVRISYTALDGGRLDDLVEYQAHGADKVQVVRGVDTPAPGEPGAFGWRGKGWLKIASSKWELLGWGLQDGVDEAAGAEAEDWIVTYFAKTMFTPAGVDVCSRRPGGLQAGTIAAIKAALAALDDGEDGVAKGELAKLVDQLFEVKIDGGLPDSSG